MWINLFADWVENFDKFDNIYQYIINDFVEQTTEYVQKSKTLKNQFLCQDFVFSR